METSLASVVDELSQLRDQLEKEVAERKRAEEASSKASASRA